MQTLMAKAMRRRSWFVMREVVVTFCIVCVSLKKQATTEFKRVYFMSVGLLNILDVVTPTIMQYFSTIISDFPF